MKKPNIVANFNFINMNGIKLTFNRLNEQIFLTKDFLYSNLEDLQNIHNQYFEHDKDIEYLTELKKLLNKKYSKN